MKLTNFRKCLILIAVLFITLLNAQNIGKIESLTNDELRFNYDVFLGTLWSYENKLIASNGTKTEEFVMLPNGELEKISYFDYSSSSGMIYGDRYYLPKNRTDIFPGVNGFYVFDLTKTPMELITYVDLIPRGIRTLSRNTFFFTESQVMVYYNGRIYRFCNETYAYQGEILVLESASFFEYSNGVFITIDWNRPDLIIRLHHLDYNYLKEISSRTISAFGIILDQISVIDNKLILSSFDTTNSAIHVIDISDPENPFTASRIRGQFYNFHYTESRIYAYNRDTSIGLQIYDLNSFGDYDLVYTKNIHHNAASVPYGIHLVDNYLYLQAHFALLVFDLSKDNEMIHTYGNVNYYPIVSHSENDVYYMEVDLFAGEQKIYSVLDNTLLVTLYLERLSLTHQWPAWFFLYNRFIIIDDRLYLSYEEGDFHYLDIYQIENQNATLLTHTQIAQESTPHISIVGNKVFFQYHSPNRTSIYDLIDDQVSYIGTMLGRIQYPFSSTQSDVILNIHNGTLFIRDLNDYTNILLESQISYMINDTFILNFDENHFSLINSTSAGDGPDRSRMYSFDINNNSLESIKSFTTSNLTSLNRVLTATSQISNNNLAEFFTINENQVVSIGNIDYGDRNVFTSSTYFFPDRRKMVLVTNGGIWTYDIRFEGDVSEYEEVTPIVRSELWGNIPNPFNPETTIRFNVAVESIVSIDIYNIRGQRVKRLLDGFYERGSHTVVWDGKDDHGRELGSGVYFYRMIAGDVVDMRRMVLLK
ncbi:MAG: T9SS type A sorting domain-containing protein [Candidatus Cloacimonetes bacterium]|nr:T9SS type A sorting domain-containing protein [Candidatus Cloacimonadota bacterium]